MDPQQLAEAWAQSFLSKPHTYNLRSFLVEAWLAGHGSAAPSQRPLPTGTRVSRMAVFATVLRDEGSFLTVCEDGSTKPIQWPWVMGGVPCSVSVIVRG